jgi:hypothetical protein
MVAVAIVGLLLWVLIERRNRFRRIAGYHQAEMRSLAHLVPVFAGSSDHPNVTLLEWHEPLRLKNERAARYLWLPVPPDPPAPE